jgi:hypothetical protein
MVYVTDTVKTEVRGIDRNKLTGFKSAGSVPIRQPGYTLKSPIRSGFPLKLFTNIDSSAIIKPNTESSALERLFDGGCCFSSMTKEFKHVKQSI